MNPDCRCGTQSTARCPFCNVPICLDCGAGGYCLDHAILSNSPDDPGTNYAHPPENAP